MDFNVSPSGGGDTLKSIHKENFINLVYQRQKNEYIPLLLEKGIDIQNSFIQVIFATWVE